MTNPDTVAAFGLFVREQFLDAETCARIIAEIRAAPTTPAPVYIEGSPDHVHENVRRATSLHPADDTTVWVHERLLEQLPALSDHFKMDLTGCEQPQFLVYRAGDFFVRHQDGNSDQLEFDHLRVRRISIVVFLNNNSAGLEAGTFSGGALLFCREGDAEHAPVALPLWGETGLLVAFASETLHEVTPVNSGERFTIINFFR